MFVHCTFGHKSHLVSIQNKYILNVKQINRTYFPFTQTHTHEYMRSAHRNKITIFIIFTNRLFDILSSINIVWRVIRTTTTSAIKEEQITIYG